MDGEQHAGHDGEQTAADREEAAQQDEGTVGNPGPDGT